MQSNLTTDRTDSNFTLLHHITTTSSCLLLGYHGVRCEYQCPPGTYGPYCTERCDCSVHAVCDHVSGECRCQPGFHVPL